MPRPVRSLSRTPARMAKAASMPVAESITGKPVFIGGSPSVPAIQAMPVAACTTWS